MSGSIRGTFNDSMTALPSGQTGEFRATPNRALHVNLRDQAGAVFGSNPNPIFVNVVNGAAGGTSSVDSAAFTVAVSSGTPAMGVFNDGLANLASGTMGTLRITNQRALHVFVDNAGSGGIAAADGTAWTAATTSTNPSGGVFNDSAAVLASGTEGTVRVTNNRAFHVSLRKQDGTELIGQQAMVTSVPVVIASNQTTIPANTAQINGVTTSTGTGVMGTGVQRVAIASDNDPITVKQATAANLLATVSIAAAQTLSTVTTVGTVSAVSALTCAAANAKVDVGLINAVVPLMGNGVTGTGSLRVTIASDNTSNSNPWLCNISQISGTAVTLGSKTSASSFPVVIASDQGNVPVSQATASSLNAQIVGTIASGSADSGNPVKTGGVYLSGPGTIASTGNRVNFLVDGQGRLCATAAPIAWVVTQATTITSSSAETTIVTAGAAGVFNDLVFLMITNSSSTACSITIKDATGGTTRMIVDVAANGGAVVPLPSPGHPQATAANNWTATNSSAAVASIHITAICHQRK